MQTKNRLLSRAWEMSCYGFLRGFFYTLMRPCVFIDMWATRNFIRRTNKRNSADVFFLCLRGLAQSSSQSDFSFLFETAEEFLASFPGPLPAAHSTGSPQMWKAHKSNSIMLSFGTSAQRRNTSRQPSEKWSHTIGHRRSNCLCHTKRSCTSPAENVAFGLQLIRGALEAVLLFSFAQRENLDLTRAADLWRGASG